MGMIWVSNPYNIYRFCLVVQVALLAAEKLVCTV